ncbi:MAG TPA: hypothetical protein PLV52_01175 [Candidatus Omnitrophota bacterium]|nr:hypothetical protein [Candidatus Omnitrophota bacterium]
MLKNTLIIILAVMAIWGICYAKDNICVLEKERKAQTPVGCVVEETGVFVGKITSSMEIAATGQRQITVENETGECRIFPFCATTKVIDAAVGAATFNVLKTGKQVQVEYVKEGSADKAKSVTVTK